MPWLTSRTPAMQAKLCSDLTSWSQTPSGAVKMWRGRLPVSCCRSQSAAAANDPHSDKTLAASQNLQELCAKGPRRTTPDLIRALEVRYWTPC
ncbi:TPA: hypothetical protein ACH3X1_003222 [Trebouxia sp. C0004]